MRCNVKRHKDKVVGMCMDIIVCLSVCGIVWGLLLLYSIRAAPPGHTFITVLRITLSELSEAKLGGEVLLYSYQHHTPEQTAERHSTINHMYSLIKKPDRRWGLSSSCTIIHLRIKIYRLPKRVCPFFMAFGQLNKKNFLMRIAFP